MVASATVKNSTWLARTVRFSSRRGQNLKRLSFSQVRRIRNNVRSSQNVAHAHTFLPSTNMPTVTPVEPKSMFIECMSHGVTGIGAWKELAEPMFKAVRARSESSFATDNR